MKRLWKWLRNIFIILILLILGLLTYAYFRIQIDEPILEDRSAFNLERHATDDSAWTCQGDWLREDASGLYEMHISGSPLELGVKHGLLAKELIAYQEDAFVAEIKNKIPSDFYLGFLKYFIGWFNRDMTDYVPRENQLEIYGVSQYTDEQYDFIAPKYQRILNYHGAHDIGHALQNMNLVACTAFGVWDSMSADGQLMIGRNFDFYVGDQFAEKKIVAFVEPNKGYRFMFITWGGLTGVVSGMNDAGLSITLNSAKSDIPTAAYTPVSIVARQILQHCSTIDEAFAKAKTFKTFVSESFYIGSAKDRKAAIIEKSPDTLALYTTSKNHLSLTNHFQSEVFKNDLLNIENIAESASMYRLQRVEELLAYQDSFGVADFARLLRDQKGLHNADIGFCNEKAINQLIAHHSIIFKPESQQVWVSTHPFQLGEYICYDLNKVWSGQADYKTNLHIDSLKIDADPFLFTKAFEETQMYRKGAKAIQKASSNGEEIEPYFIEKFLQSNPKFFHVYKVVGDYYASKGMKEKAISTYEKAFLCEFPRIIDKTDIEESIAKLKEK
ncbi:MAG: choloylglycine hydrolase [Bacteroidales bacterium]|nr:choloylglycine hydrolase [Bacteroidales bacterium]